jgi:condensin complex subunit 3
MLSGLTVRTYIPDFYISYADHPADSFWNSVMTPEKAFLVRVFTKYCVTQKEEAQLEGKLPVVTGFAFKIQDVYNSLRQRIESDLALKGDEEALANGEEARMDLEFILGEMLRVAMHLDYGDEIGRRRMFQLVSA